MFTVEHVLNIIIKGSLQFCGFFSVPFFINFFQIDLCMLDAFPTYELVMLWDI